MLNQISKLYEILYVSTYASGLSTNKVRQIVINARTHNIKHNITGILIFDGAQFCQLIEGPREKVFELEKVIAKDKRHQNFNLLHQGTSVKRKFGDFAMGLATLGDDEEFLQKLGLLKGKTALKAFIAGLLNLDTID